MTSPPAAQPAMRRNRKTPRRRQQHVQRLGEHPAQMVDLPPCAGAIDPRTSERLELVADLSCRETFRRKFRRRPGGLPSIRVGDRLAHPLEEVKADRNPLARLKLFRNLLDGIKKCIDSEERLANAKKLLAVLREMQFPFLPLPESLAEPRARTNIVFALSLFEVCPQFVAKVMRYRMTRTIFESEIMTPRRASSSSLTKPQATIEFDGKLNGEVIRKVRSETLRDDGKKDDEIDCDK
eukprot:757371-Hanusia_phi.AAC.3